MNLSAWQIGLLLGSSALGIIGYAQPIGAQVIPDNTLSVGERSQVSGSPNFQIDGGAKRESNLFHSFDQLSVPTGGSIYFNNAADVQNIFSRVTGGSASNIDGLIRANGTANLFLLNPNGILFGPNGSLNIGGSFVATTANNINFADGFQYSAINPQTTPILTMSAPVGLQMGANSGPIEKQGNGYDLSVIFPIFTPLIRGSGAAGLQVPAGQTLALIGGDIDVDGATLRAEQGQIELGSVRDGLVTVSATSAGFTFDYPGSQRFGDIRLSQQALADASGGGLIQVQGNNVSLTDGSLLLIQNQENQGGGSIRVNAAQSLEVNGSSPDGSFAGGLESETVGVGQGAEILVSARQLLIQDGAEIQTISYSLARSGNVTMRISDSVQITGFSFANPSLGSAIGTTTYDAGDAGDIFVSAQALALLDGGNITSATFGIGHSGDVTVNVFDSIKLMGQSSVFNSSVIGAISIGTGDAGQLTVNTSRLMIQDGGAVSTSTVGSGSAGSVTINAQESVEVSGSPPVPSPPSRVGSSAPIVSDVLRQAYQLPLAPSGASGNVTINTERLSITNGATVDVSNDGVGNAGTLEVNANSIAIDRSGLITAATASGEGGNINLNVRDFLLLRNNSQVTASASGNGNGGNIQISAGSIVAVPAENSDIRANSVNARGGNVTINTAGIFGIQARPQETPLSDITATGANSASGGIVQINIDQLNSTFGLVELPTSLTESSQLIAQGCLASQGNSFIVSGRGGLPPTPQQQLDDDANWQDRRRLTVEQPPTASAIAPHTQRPEPGASPTEAIGWQTDSSGDIQLVAASSESTVPYSPSQFVACQGRQ